MNPLKNTRKLNITMVIKIMGWLIMIESLFMLVPTIVALSYGEQVWQTFAFVDFITFLTGFIINRRLHPASNGMGKREGFLLTALVWLVFSLFGMLPFIFNEHSLSVTDAYFEAMAGFTTTGCSVYANPEELGYGLNIWRALMQWIGGMGIILFTLAVLPMLNHSGGMQMFNAEVTGITHEKTRPRVSQTAKSLWIVYISLTALCAFLLWLGPMDFFQSVCHAFGTLSTGGFSSLANCVEDWNSSYIDVVITIFMFLGGASFSAIYFAAIGKFKPLYNNQVLRLYIYVVVGVTAVIAIAELLSSSNPTVRNVLIMPLFQTVATMTSTGYTAPNLSAWPSVALTLMIPLIFFGACAGSTSGGAKIDRLLVLIKELHNSLKRALQPNLITVVSINGKILSSDIVWKTINFLSLYCITILVGAILLSMLGVDIVDSFFCSLSCMTNYGVGADAYGIGAGFSAVPAVGKWILSILMLIGRLEVFTVLVLFTRNFWHK